MVPSIRHFIFTYTLKQHIRFDTSNMISWRIVNPQSIIYGSPQIPSSEQSREAVPILLLLYSIIEIAFS